MKGALAGAFTAWLGLIALQALGTTGGSGRVSEFFTDADRVIKRLLDPTVPAIPDLRTAATETSTVDTTPVVRTTIPTNGLARLRVPQ